MNCEDVNQLIAQLTNIENLPVTKPSSSEVELMNEVLKENTDSAYSSSGYSSHSRSSISSTATKEHCVSIENKIEKQKPETVFGTSDQYLTLESIKMELALLDQKETSLKKLILGPRQPLKNLRPTSPNIFRPPPHRQNSLMMNPPILLRPPQRPQRPLMMHPPSSLRPPPRPQRPLMMHPSSLLRPPPRPQRPLMMYPPSLSRPPPRPQRPLSMHPNFPRPSPRPQSHLLMHPPPMFLRPPPAKTSDGVSTSTKLKNY